jgi:N-acetylglucosaminyl-diphospho-decaprenol L-rhamnosyltransferase
MNMVEAASIDSATLQVVIVTHNSREVLSDCLDSLGPPGGRDKSVEITVIDSGSDSLEYLRDVKADHVVTVPNLGYGTCANRAAVESRSTWLAVMNPDTRISRSKLLRLAELLDCAGADAGAPELLDDVGSIRPAPLRAAGPVWRRPRRQGRPLAECDIYREVEVLQGSILLLRRSAFELIGGFDTSFFLYSEEDDLAMRLRSSGSKLVVAKDIHGVHVGEGSSQGIMSEWRMGQRLRGRWQFFRKHYSIVEAALVLIRDSVRMSGTHGVGCTLRSLRIALRNPRAGLSYTPGLANGSSSSARISAKAKRNAHG